MSVCFTHPFSITHFVYFRQEPVFVKVKIFWPWRVPFLLTLIFLFLLLPFIGPLFCISWTFKEKWQSLFLSLAVRLSARKHGVAVLFWPFLLEATLVNSGLFSPFLFHFSMWFFVLKTLLRYIGLCLHKCYPECFFKWAIDFFINLWSDSF